MSEAAPSAPLPLPAAALGRWEGEIGTIRLSAGPGTLSAVGDAARALGAHRALLVGDAGLAAAGHVATAGDSLAAAGLQVVPFVEVEEQPTSDAVEAAARELAGVRHDVIVAVGGGSVLDTAKALNLLHAGGGRMEDYWGLGKARGEPTPAIAVPATGGTGSEAQSYALIARSSDGRKMACGDRRVRFRHVLLDPEVVATAPRRVAAAAGLDAVSHALETWATVRRTPLSRLYSAEAWRLLSGALEAHLARPTEPGPAAAMLWGAHLAGAAIEQSMLGAAHAAANPLTARHGVLHGVAVALTLPAVVRLNARHDPDLYRPLEPQGGEALALRVEELRRAAGLPATLEEVGVSPAAFPELARLACAEWTGTFNPRPMDHGAYQTLYEAIHAG